MTRTFGSGVAHFGWWFAAFWISGVAVMTYLVVRAPPADLGWFIWPIVAVFWLFAVGLGIATLRWSTTRIRVFDDGRLEVVQRAPLRRIVQLYGPRAWPASRFVEDTDSENDPYFRCELDVASPFQRPPIIAEGHARAAVEAARAAFEALRPG